MRHSVEENRVDGTSFARSGVGTSVSGGPSVALLEKTERQSAIVALTGLRRRTNEFRNLGPPYVNNPG
jgi:hypothetical protein